MTEVFDSGLIFSPTVTDSDPNLASALANLKAAQNGLGTNREPSFWAAVLLAKAGRIDEARAYLAFAKQTNSRWHLFLESVAAAGVLPTGSALLDKK